MNKHWTLPFLFWPFLFVFLLLCNLLMPYVADDYILRPTGWSGVLDFYQHNGGRFGSLLTSLFVHQMSSLGFDFLNAVLGCVFFLLIFVLVEGRRPNSLSDYSTLSLLLTLILLTTMFGSVFIWKSGAVDYLWGAILIVLHWIPYRFFYKKGEYNLSILQGAAFVLLSIFSGWSSEQVGIVSIVLHIGLISYLIFTKRHIPLWYWAGVIAFIIGYGLLYCSPGIANRASGCDVYMSIPQLVTMPLMALLKRILLTLGFATSKSALDILILSLVLMLVSRKNKIVLTVCIGGGLSVVLAALHLSPMVIQITYFYFRITALLLLLGVSIYCILKKHHIVLSLMYIVYFIALLSMIQMAGHVSERTKCAQSILLLIMSLMILRSTFKNIWSSALFPTLAIVSVICVTFFFVDLRQKQDQFIREIQEGKQRNDNPIRISSYLFSSPYKNIGTSDWASPSDDPDWWFNKIYSDYFGVEAIVFYE